MTEDRKTPFGRIEAERRLSKIKNVLLVGSGKGGVGKSFISASLALTLSRKGQRTAILDLDIHGASIPNYVGVRPPLESNKEGLEPKQVGFLKVMSIALMTGDKPTPLRGIQKENLITQLFSLTNWGNLDYLVIDLPPGTGDEILSAFRLFGTKARMILVTTASLNAIKIVSKLRALAKLEKIPVEGIVLNMGYLTSGGKRVYPFGRISWKALEKKLDTRVLAEVPLDPSVNSSTLGDLLGRKGGKIHIEVERLVKEICREHIGSLSYP